MTEADRFMAKVSQGRLGECWTWTACKSTDGYGLFWFRGRMERAHRVALILAGASLSEDNLVDHTCRNRLCVNPMHLRPATRIENVHENSEALAHLNSLKTHCLKGHPLSGDNLVMDRGKRRCRTCKAETLRAIRAKKRSGLPSAVRSNRPNNSRTPPVSHPIQR